MVDGTHLKRRLGQYGGLWLGGFVLAGAGILIASLFTDLIAAMDLVLPFVMGVAGMALSAGMIVTLMSSRTLGTKLVVVLVAVLLVLPLLWASVSAAVLIAFFAQRSIEYSVVYAGFQIGISQVLYPVGKWFSEAGMFRDVWTAFQMVASVVGFFSAMAGLWPTIRRVLGPEPAQEA